MTRTARLTTPGVLYEVVSRLLDGRALTSDEERERFLVLFGRALERSDWRCVAYCLKGDRLRFAMIAGEQTLDSWTRRAHGAFARWVNRRQARRGALFADRPSTRAVSTNCVASVIADLHRNPTPAAATSSHQIYLGLSAAPRWLQVVEGLERAGFADRQSFNEYVGVNRHEWLARASLMRVPARGDGLDTSKQLPAVVSLHRIPSGHDASCVPALLFAVAQRCELPLGAFQRRYARGPVSKAKRVAIHAAVNAGISVAHVAAALDVTRQRGSAIAQLELVPDEAVLADDVAKLLAESCGCVLRPYFNSEPATSNARAA